MRWAGSVKCAIESAASAEVLSAGDIGDHSQLPRWVTVWRTEVRLRLFICPKFGPSDHGEGRSLVTTEWSDRLP